MVSTKRSLRKCNSLLFSVMNWLFFSCTCMLDWGVGGGGGMKGFSALGKLLFPFQ